MAKKLFLRAIGLIVSLGALTLATKAVGNSQPRLAEVAAHYSVTNLRCEYIVNPLGVDTPAPRLFWTIESSLRAQRQTAYRILVASSERILADDRGDLWDSRKVASDETIQICYRG